MIQRTQHGIVGAILLLAAVAILIGGTNTPATAEEDKLSELLQETNLKYREINDYSYVVPFETEQNGTIDVFVTYNNEKKNFVLIFTTLLDYEDGHEFTPDVMARALVINNDYPAIKLCIDTENGDLDCQSEIYVRTLDAKSLDMHINFVAGVADAVGAELTAMEEGEAEG